MHEQNHLKYWALLSDFCYLAGRAIIPFSGFWLKKNTDKWFSRSLFEWNFFPVKSSEGTGRSGSLKVQGQGYMVDEPKLPSQAISFLFSTNFLDRRINFWMEITSYCIQKWYNCLTGKISIWFWHLAWRQCICIVSYSKSELTSTHTLVHTQLNTWSTGTHWRFLS